MASLTKIMTLFACLEICNDYQLDFYVQTTEITHLATRIGGTTANLQEFDKLTIFDLFHGLMLPSGNDAAISLAIYFGMRLRKPRMGED